MQCKRNCLHGRSFYSIITLLRFKGEDVLSSKKNKRGRYSGRQLLFLSLASLLLIFISVRYLGSEYRTDKGSQKNDAKTQTKAGNNHSSSYSEFFDKNGKIIRPTLEVKLLDINSYSRSGIPMKKVNGIVIHYVSNPGTSAMENRNYFENLKDSHATKASAHFIIGLDGEIVQCIPTKEIAYASNTRNTDTIAIECCHPGEDGKFNDKTYRSLVWLTSWLCQRYGLSSDSVIRHYDVTGKLCPIYYVKNPQAWKDFRGEVAEVLRESK